MTSTRRAPRLLLSLALTAAALGTPHLAAAQPKDATSIGTARDLYNEGLALRDKGDLGGALQKFMAAHALARTPITGLELARTHAARGEPVEAREVCLGIGRTPVSPEETARSAEARRDAARLADEMMPKIASLEVRVVGVPPGVTAHLVIDGKEIPEVAITAAQKVNPGGHEVLARAGKGKATRQSVVLTEGESRTVELRVEPPPPEPGAAAGAGAGAARGPVEGKRSVFVPIGGTAALAGFAIGSVTGLIAMARKSDLDDACPGGKCPPSERDNLSTAKTMGTVSTVGFVVGVVGGAVLVYGLVDSPKARGGGGPSVAAAVGPGSVGIHGRF